MKNVFFLTALVILSVTIAYSQPAFTYKIKADTLLVTNDSCEAEFVLENHTRAVKGFLFNTGNGRTVFKQGLVKVNDSTYIIGNDSLKLSGLGGNYIQNQNASAQSANSYINGTGSFAGGISVGAQFNTTNVTPNFYNSYKAQIWDSLLVEGTGASQVRFTGNNAHNPGFVFNGNTSNTHMYTLSSQNLTTSGAGGTQINNNKLTFYNTGYIEPFQQPLTIKKSWPGVVAPITLILDSDTSGMTLGGLTPTTYKILQNKYLGTEVSYLLGTGGGVFTEDLTVHGLTIGDGKGTGIFNTALGFESLSANTTGHYNTAAGHEALKRNTIGKYNAAFGMGALSFNTEADMNSAFGLNALQITTTGGGNTAVGAYSMKLSTTGYANTAVGWNSMGGNTTGFFNTAVGVDAARDNGAGEYNSAFGYAALNYNTANHNVGFGAYAVYNNITGTNNAGFGNNTLYYNTTGSNNAAFGAGALYGQTPAFTGSNNTALGVSAGNTLTTGSNNIFIGYNVLPNIGVTSSNQLNIGNWIYGDNGKIGIGVTAPTAKLQLAAGTTTANTAPLKFTSGTNLTTPESGAVEFDGTNYYVTSSTTRYTLAKTLTAAAALNFTSTSAQSSSDLTITVTGAADGDAVSLGVPNASINNNSSYSAWVSASNTVTVRFNNHSSGSIDPASGTFRVSVIKY
jgi:hypothetical protein